jgi:hypothetical protein
MSKHDTIANNLIALTRSRSFIKAVEGWSVAKLVTLPKKQRQACELCGTRFRDGAVVKHRRSKATIVVGGTCLWTLQAHRFPSRFNFSKAKQITFKTLHAHYGSLIDPSNWLLWVRRNAPTHLIQAVADLYTLGTVASPDQLQKLIQYHDKKRLFPRTALLTAPLVLEHALGIKIPKYITITQARQFAKKGQHTFSEEMLKAAVSEYRKKYVLPYMKGDWALESLWRSLGALEKRAVTALVALDDMVARTKEPLVPDKVASNFPRPGEAPMFLWNAKVGLGFVSEEDFYEPSKASVWLWRTGQYKRAVYNIEYWRGVKGCSIESVEQLEDIAFKTDDIQSNVTIHDFDSHL